MNSCYKITPRSDVKIDYPEGLEPTCLDEMKETAVKVVSFVIFPWGFAQFVVTKVICPESSFFFRLNLRNALTSGKERLINELHGESHSIPTPDGVVLDSLFFQSNRNLDKVVIYCGGRSFFYERIYNEINRFLNRNVSVLAFNSRGVNDSTGSVSPKRFGLDTYSVAEYLHKKKGFDSEKILFFGHSLGAYRALAGAALFQKKYPDKRISVLIDRAFVSLKKEIEVSYGKKVAVFASLLGWDLDCMGQWDQITGRGVWGVNKIIVYHPQDRIIPVAAQLFTAVEDKGDELNFPIRLHNETSQEQEVYAHNRLYNDHEDQIIIKYIQYTLNNSSNFN